MRNIIILAKSKHTADALEKYICNIIGEGGENYKVLNKIIWRNNYEIGSKIYENIIYRMDEIIAEQNSNNISNIFVMVDSIRFNYIDPSSNSDSWNDTIAMLILIYPEVKWVFGKINDIVFKNNEHSLMSIFYPNKGTLFDPSGIRNKIRDLINIRNKDASLPIRKEIAASIDEELDYALFNAYTAYRFGYRGEAVTTWALMEYLFGPSATDRAVLESDPDPEVAKCFSDREHAFDLLLEDININFPDKPSETHLSTLDSFQDEKGKKNGRAEHCSMLGYDKKGEKSSFRIIISSGQSGSDLERMRKNEDYLMRNKPDGYGFVLKPVGGMFDLWEKARLFSRLDPRKEGDCTGRQSGCAPGYVWPPSVPSNTEYLGGHSAPGKLMLIARNLIRRADALRSNANTVEEFIRGAVLATDALELLRYQTPTLALQALSLKHEYEVRAEVAFLGVGHHFEVKMRFDELEREVKAASRFFQAGRRRLAELDTLVSIGNRLMLVFRGAGQFDEENYCLVRVRSWHRKSQMMQTRNPLGILQQLGLSYAEWLLVSPARFFGALSVWFFLFFGLWYWVGPSAGEYSKSASLAWNAFVVASPDSTGDVNVFILNCVATSTGLFHLGIFIAYIYSVVTRK